MADTSTITIQQAFQTPYVQGVISRISTPDTAFQRFYGAMENRTFTPSRVFGWDIFDMTRTIATAKAPMTEATVIRKKQIGTQYGALLRIHEKKMIFDEEIANLRPPGSPIGTLDQRGEQWAVRQIKDMSLRHRNMLEWAMSKTLQGGFGLKVAGEFMYFTELGTSGNAFDIDMNIPSSHKTNAGGIIGNWDDPSADVIDQIMQLEAQAIKETGYPITCCWISRKTLGYLMKNVSLSLIAGSANRVWSSWPAESAKVEPANRSLGAYGPVVFSAFPHLKFFTNDVVMNLGSSSDPQGTDTSDGTNTSRLLPENMALFTPDPDGSWMTIYEGHEPVRETVVSQSEFARGFKTWVRPFVGSPPGREFYMLDNFLPVLPIPRAVWPTTVW